MIENIEEALVYARRGAEMLGADVVGKIDPETIRSIHEPSQCVLTAVYGSYCKGMAELKLSDDNTCDAGFCCSEEEDEYLVAAWRQIIRETAA